MVNFGDSPARIVLASDPDAWIGADNIDDCATKKVVRNGTMQTWTAKGRCYVLDDQWYINVEGDYVVVRLNGTECITFHVVLVRDDVYRIERYGTNLAWTVGTDDKAPVTLAPAGSVEPEFQEFRFEFLE